jgi:Transposase domain (DUF772)
MKPSASRSRVTVSFNPLLPEFRADPYQTFHRLRAGAPVRLALVTVLQSTEGLSDRPAADSVHSRIDWKRVLGLEITGSGLDHTVLSEFHARLVYGKAEWLLLDTLLEWLRERGLVKKRGRQRTDSTRASTRCFPFTPLQGAFP